MIPSWAVLEWECCLKHSEDERGSSIYKNIIIRVADCAVDDFAG